MKRSEMYSIECWLPENTTQKKSTLIIQTELIAYSSEGGAILTILSRALGERGNIQTQILKSDLGGED